MSKQIDQIPFFIRDVFETLKTLYLFTHSDLKTILGPESLFALFVTLSGPALTTNFNPCLTAILPRLALAACWIWINLLCFCIGNQRKPRAIIEDSMNKPWRPLPSKRLSASQAYEMHITAHVVALSTSFAVGGVWQCVLLMALGYVYSDLGAGDRSLVLRNGLNVAGFLCFGMGATSIAAGASEVGLTTAAYQWFGIIAAVIFTTVHVQDMYDQEGDTQCGRRTIPIVFGDGVARLSLVFLIAVWSCLVPVYWSLNLVKSLPLLALGAIIGYRYLAKRSAESDRNTSKVWNLWMTWLYLMPLLSMFNL